MMYTLWISYEIRELVIGKGQNPTSIIPKYEDEEDEQCKEDGNVVHCAQHDHKLPAEIRHEADKLQDPQQSEGTQDGQAGTTSRFTSLTI